MYVYRTVNFLTKCYSFYRGFTYPVHINYKPQKGQISRGPPLFETWNIYIYNVWVISFAVSFNCHHDTNYITWERVSIEELFNSNLPVTTSEEIVSIDDCCRRFSPLRTASFLKQGPELVKKPS